MLVLRKSATTNNCKICSFHCNILSLFIFYIAQNLSDLTFVSVINRSYIHMFKKDL